jgi:hypothetical protein
MEHSESGGAAIGRTPVMMNPVWERRADVLGDGCAGGGDSAIVIALLSVNERWRAILA